MEWRLDAIEEDQEESIREGARIWEGMDEDDGSFGEDQFDYGLFRRSRYGHWSDELRIMCR
jgi:hypothetical protein